MAAVAATPAAAAEEPAGARAAGSRLHRPRRRSSTSTTGRLHPGRHDCQVRGRDRHQGQLTTPSRPTGLRQAGRRQYRLRHRGAGRRVRQTPDRGRPAAAARQVQIANLGSPGPDVMKILDKADPGNKHPDSLGLGFTTVGINRTRSIRRWASCRCRERLGPGVSKPSTPPSSGPAASPPRFADRDPPGRAALHRQDAYSN